MLSKIFLNKSYTLLHVLFFVIISFLYNYNVVDGVIYTIGILGAIALTRILENN